jgi:hypothetical protein
MHDLAASFFHLRAAVLIGVNTSVRKGAKKQTSIEGGSCDRKGSFSPHSNASSIQSAAAAAQDEPFRSPANRD